MVIFFIVLFCLVFGLISRWFDTAMVIIAGFELLRFLLHAAIRWFATLLSALATPLIFTAIVFVVLLIINYLPMLFGKRSLLKHF